MMEASDNGQFLQMIYNHITPQQVNVDFINGYLSPWALLMDYCTHEAGFTYFFKQMNKAGNLHETVRQNIESVVGTTHRDSGFADSVAWLTENNGLIEIANWETNLTTHLLVWFNNLQKTLITSFRNVWPDDFLLKDFIEVLKGLFTNQFVRCWKLEEQTKNGLYYDWGGIGFDDFFFESRQHFYHLHFELSD